MCWQPDKGLRPLAVFPVWYWSIAIHQVFSWSGGKGWWIHKSLWEYAGLRTCILFLSQAVVPRTSANVRSGGLRLALSAKDKGWHTSGISLTIVAVAVQLLSCVWLSATHGLSPSKLFLLQDSPGKKTGVNCHFLLQGVFATQGSEVSLLQWQADYLRPSHLGT